MNKPLAAVLTVMLAFALGVCLLLTSAQVTAFDINAYEKAYDKYDLGKTTGLTKDDYIGISRGILGYLNDNTDSIYNSAKIFGSDRYLFNQKELTHMVDVKTLFQRGFLIRNLSVISLLTILAALFLTGGRSRKRVGKALFNGSVALIVFCMLTLIAINSDFYNYFTLFHEMLFTNDLWLLNPETDLLINMYPLGFFQDIASRMLIIFFVQLLIAGAIGYFVYKTSRIK
jgi:integral membrane protein (TIGR01906 family)